MAPKNIVERSGAERLLWKRDFAVIAMTDPLSCICWIDEQCCPSLVHVISANINGKYVLSSNSYQEIKSIITMSG